MFVLYSQDLIPLSCATKSIQSNCGEISQNIPTHTLYGHNWSSHGWGPQQASIGKDQTTLIIPPHPSGEGVVREKIGIDSFQNVVLN